MPRKASRFVSSAGGREIPLLYRECSEWEIAVFRGFLGRTHHSGRLLRTLLTAGFAVNPEGTAVALAAVCSNRRQPTLRPAVQ